MLRRAVVCFFGDVVAPIASERGAAQIAQLYAEHGVHPIYELEHDALALGHPVVVAAAVRDEGTS